jgi:hypothetical protein
VAPGLTAWAAYQASEDPHDTQARQDAFRTAATALGGYASYPLAEGALHALSTHGRPADAVEPEKPQITLVEPPPEPGVDLKDMNTKEAAEAILKRLGGSPTGSLTKDRIAIQGAYPNASPDVKAALAASNPKLKAPDVLNKALEAHWRSKFLIPGALLAGAAALSPDEAEAASAGPRPSEIGPLPSRTEMAMHAASKFPGKLLGAADTASYAHPVIGAARQAYDVIANGEPFLTSPEEAMARENDLAKARNLEQAQAEDRRQRAEMMPKREPIGAEAANAVPKNGGVSDYRDVGVGGEGRPSAYVPAAKMGFDPADLPEYERGLLEKGIHPAEAAMQLMPHARAGAEAVKRGEDFWGGSDQFERERAALAGFYNLASKDADAVAGSTLSAPRSKLSPAPSLSVPPPANDGGTQPFAKGGRVAPAKNRAHNILKLYARK